MIGTLKGKGDIRILKTGKRKNRATGQTEDYTFWGQNLNFDGEEYSLSAFDEKGKQSIIALTTPLEPGFKYEFDYKLDQGKYHNIDLARGFTQAGPDAQPTAMRAPSREDDVVLMHECLEDAVKASENVTSFNPGPKEIQGIACTLFIQRKIKGSF